MKLYKEHSSTVIHVRLDNGHAIEMQQQRIKGLPEVSGLYAGQWNKIGRSRIILKCLREDIRISGQCH